MANELIDFFEKANDDVGSVSMNPLDLFLAPLDDFILVNFLMSYVFWLAIALLASKLYKIQHPE